MNILLIGSGGREHALAWKLVQSKLLTNLFIAPGNPGTAEFGKNLEVDILDFDAIAKIVAEYNIYMVVVGPEAPLVEGIADYFEEHDYLRHVRVIGPSRLGAMLEGSKDFAKDFMNRHGIPTATHRTFSAGNYHEAIPYLESMKPPYVLKADGLAAGKGVIICDSLAEACSEITEMIQNRKFGEASAKVVIESFLKGVELSVFVLTDGKSYVILPEAKDYKRIGEGDTGLNTGGMGAVSPVPFADDGFMKKVEDSIIKPTVDGLFKEKIKYRGFVFFGLINVDGDPFVIEYNVRMGDPETEVVMPRIQSDLVDLFVKTADGKLDEATVVFNSGCAVTVMLVSGGYPGRFSKGYKISKIKETEGSFVFHAGTSDDGDDIVTAGGRVLAVTTLASDYQKALEITYKNAGIIDYQDKYYRTDIGKDLNL